MPSRARTKRPRDPNQLAWQIVQEATGQAPTAPEVPDTRNQAALALSRLGASKGGMARAAALSPAKRRAIEKSPDFKKAQRFRAGIEGRISVLFRGRGMKRCRARGEDRFQAFIGFAVFTNNLMKIAEILIGRENRKKPRCRAA